MIITVKAKIAEAINNAFINIVSKITQTKQIDMEYDRGKAFQFCDTEDWNK